MSKQKRKRRKADDVALSESLERPSKRQTSRKRKEASTLPTLQPEYDSSAPVMLPHTILIPSSLLHQNSDMLETQADSEGQPEKSSKKKGKKTAPKEQKKSPRKSKSKEDDTDKDIEKTKSPRKKQGNSEI